MKRIVFLIGVMLLAMLMAGTRQSVVLEADILIDAPKEQVWRTLIGFHHYPKWNPYINEVHIQGSDPSLITGRRLSLSMRPAAMAQAQGTETDVSDQGHEVEVVAVLPQQELRWASSLWLPFLFDSEHWFKLETVGDRTILRNGEKISGLFLFLVNRQATRDGFVAMNKALKQRVEKLYPRQQ